MKAYLETTIFNRYFEEGQEFAGETKLMFERIAAGKIIGFTSVAVLEELEKAPDLKRARMMGLINKFKITTLEVHEIAYKLADAYVENEIMPLKFRLNGIHIAMAAVFDLDCIISLDFHHINKWKTKAETEVVNRKNGFSHILICTPGEVVYEDE